MKYKILSLILVFSMLLGLAACGKEGPTTAPGTSPAAPTAAPESTAAILFPQVGDLHETAVSTEHFSFNRGEMAYLFAVSVSDFLTDYYDYISYLGLDLSKSFKTQTSYFGGGTWFDFFLTDAKAYATDYLIFCEAGLAAGLSLDEEDTKYIEDQKKILEEEAASHGWDIDTYLGQLYSTNLGWEYIQSSYEKLRLAQKAYRKLIGDVPVTEEALEAEFQANSKNYSLIDYYAIDFGDGENIPDAVLEEARTALKSVASLDDFKEAVRSFVRETRTTKTIEDAGGLDKYLDKYLSQGLHQAQSYTDTDFFRWAYGEEGKEGSVFTIESSKTNAPVAYFLVKKPYRDETVTIDIRHILFMVKNYNGRYETAESAHAEAEKVMQQWLADGGSVERFIELCAQYSEDGTAHTGGLYTNVPRGQMVQPFNDWCFDESRRQGDYGIVDTDYGSHIMYFEGSHVNWRLMAEDAILDRAYQKLCDDQMKLTPITEKKEVLESLNW